MYRFIGQYTNGHTTVDIDGVLFEGHEPREVENPSRRFLNHPEVEKVHPLDHDGDGEKGGSLQGEKATRRGRKQKGETA